MAYGLNSDDSSIEAIIDGAHTGEIWGGRIFVPSLEECVCIRTREKAPMRSRTTRIFALLALVWTGTSTTRAASVDYDLGFYSAYAWRGISFTDGAVFQPSLTAAHDSGFRFNIWGNLDIDDVNGLSGEFQEVDLTLSYSFGEGRVRYDVGLIEYLFPSGVGPATREVYFGLGFDAPVAPSVTIYYDFDEVEAFYSTFALEHGGELSDTWSYTAALIVGYADEDFALAYGGSNGGLFDGQVSLSLDYVFGRCGLSIFTAYSDSLDTDILPDQPVDFWGGVSFNLSF